MRSAGAARQEDGCDRQDNTQPLRAWQLGSHSAAHALVQSLSTLRSLARQRHRALLLILSIQRQGTWYEFLLKQFNPNDIDYGQWLEHERQAFLEARLRNPYFLYCAATTLALLVMAIVCAKLRIDHRRAMWITAEMMADLYNQDAYSRKIAQEAIERYNTHIERCNRAIEAAEHGDNASGKAPRSNN